MFMPLNRVPLKTLHHQPYLVSVQVGYSNRMLGMCELNRSGTTLEKTDSLISLTFKALLPIPGIEWDPKRLCSRLLSRHAIRKGNTSLQRIKSNWQNKNSYSPTENNKPHLVICHPLCLPSQNVLGMHKCREMWLILKNNLLKWKTTKKKRTKFRNNRHCWN